MTDEITREEAKEMIQRIRNCVGEFKPTSFILFPVYRNTIPALDMAIKSLEQDRPIGHWISIKDRLPEDGTWNLFTDGKNRSVERYKCDAIDHFFPEGRWFTFADVVAWMPLPEKYNAENN